MPRDLFYPTFGPDVPQEVADSIRLLYDAIYTLSDAQEEPSIGPDLRREPVISPTTTVTLVPSTPREFSVPGIGPVQLRTRPLRDIPTPEGPFIEQDFGTPGIRPRGRGTDVADPPPTFPPTPDDRGRTPTLGPGGPQTGGSGASTPGSLPSGTTGTIPGITPRGRGIVETIPEPDDTRSVAFQREGVQVTIQEAQALAQHPSLAAHPQLASALHASGALDTLAGQAGEPQLSRVQHNELDERPQRGIRDGQMFVCEEKDPSAPALGPGSTFKEPIALEYWDADERRWKSIIPGTHFSFNSTLDSRGVIGVNNPRIEVTELGSTQFFVGAPQDYKPWLRVQANNLDRPVKSPIWIESMNTNSDRIVVEATNSTPIVVTTSIAHGFETGDTLIVKDVTGNTAANGQWKGTVISSLEVSLNGSSGNGAYTGGGTIAEKRVNNGIFIAHYSYRDNGGDASGIVSSEFGEGNAATFRVAVPPAGLPEPTRDRQFGRAIEASSVGNTTTVSIRNRADGLSLALFVGPDPGGEGLRIAPGVNRDNLDSRYAIAVRSAQDNLIGSPTSFADDLGTKFLTRMDGFTTIAGAGQSGSAFTDTGSRRAALFLNDVGNLVGSGGAIMFGGKSSEYYAVIKGLLSTGTSRTLGDLALMFRQGTGDTQLAEKIRFTSGGRVQFGNPSGAPQVFAHPLNDTAFAMRPLGGNFNGFLEVSSSGTANASSIRTSIGGNFDITDGFTQMSFFNTGGFIAVRGTSGANGILDIYLGVAADPTPRFRFSPTSFIPLTDNTASLGSTTERWAFGRFVTASLKELQFRDPGVLVNAPNVRPDPDLDHILEVQPSGGNEVGTIRVRPSGTAVGSAISLRRVASTSDVSTFNIINLGPTGALSIRSMGGESPNIDLNLAENATPVTRYRFGNLQCSIGRPMRIQDGALTSPAAQALLELTSTTRGLLLMRMTTTQRDAISAPPDGLMLYNTTTNKFQGRAGAAWVDFH